MSFPNRQIEDIEQDLLREFGEILGCLMVSKVVRESYGVVSDKATVSDFVGMLARRASPPCHLTTGTGRALEPRHPSDADTNLARVPSVSSR